MGFYFRVLPFSVMNERKERVTETMNKRRKIDRNWQTRNRLLTIKQTFESLSKDNRKKYLESTKCSGHLLVYSSR